VLRLRPLLPWVELCDVRRPCFLRIGLQSVIAVMFPGGALEALGPEFGVEVRDGVTGEQLRWWRA
jgi:hypothetical protein